MIYIMRIRLLTYNIHKAIGVDGSFRPDRIIAILKRYNADITLLQEVDRGAPRSDHLDLASMIATALDYEFRAVGMNHYMKKGKYGNATLTRFPIGRQRNIDLTCSWRKRRGAQHTTIEIPHRGGAVSLDIFNVHLGLSAMERREQVRRILESTDMRRLSKADACIVAGDTNDWRGVLKRQRFADAGFSCATNRRPGSRWSIKTFPSYAPTGGLDKIFYRGPIHPVHVRRSRLKLAQLASDHLPVIADFSV